LPARDFFAHFAFLNRTPVRQPVLLWRGHINEYDYQDPNGRQHGDKTYETKSSSYFARPKNC
jgi:hypothetical protein